MRLSSAPHLGAVLQLCDQGVPSEKTSQPEGFSRPRKFFSFHTSQCTRLDPRRRVLVVVQTAFLHDAALEQPSGGFRCGALIALLQGCINVLASHLLNTMGIHGREIPRTNVALPRRASCNSNRRLVAALPDTLKRFNKVEFRVQQPFSQRFPVMLSCFWVIGLCAALFPSFQTSQ